MTVRRVMGIETEYGISVPGDPQANPMVLSGHVVHAYASSQGLPAARASWDYADEDPLRDARGWQMSRGAAHPSQLTDVEDPTMANVVLTNGARLYVDHAHPEYSSPEVTTPRAAVTWDRAGELIMREAVQRIQSVPAVAGIPVNLYKNNTDGKGASYGTHENYLMRRETPFLRIVAQLTPFFVARQVMCGSGRVGIGVDSKIPGYQIAQRSDFFEAEVGLETTLKRPIINTRDEPHALADLYRRLHVIIGDANHCDVAGLLKMGTTSLVLAMIEDGTITRDLSVRNPVQTLHAVSHDIELRETIELTSGERILPIELLWAYFEMAQEYLEERGGMSDDDTAEVMHWWERVLTLLQTDRDAAAPYVDWVGKLRVLERYRDRGQLSWESPQLRAIDIQWSDVRLEKGLFNRMALAGQFHELVPAEEVKAAVTEPPEDTRAYFRGTCISRFPDNVVAASWDSVIFDVPESRALQRVPMLEPLRGTRAAVGELMETSPDAGTMLRRLSAAAEPGPARG
ncbi:MAG: proteasome accessory factor PafA2 [Actinomycetales bacterium]|nr:proteasome accessory factor PafA2 [Actinomycetales bacterium]